MQDKSRMDAEQLLKEKRNLFSHWTRRKILLIGIALIVVMVVAGLLWKGHSQSGAPQYQTAEVQRGDLTVEVSATGTLQPTNEVDVSSELSGIMKTVEADYNDRVKVGQVLARLDTTKLDAQLTQSLAALESSRAKLLEAEATVAEKTSKRAQYLRVREMSKGKVPSQTEMDAADADWARAKADAASAKAAVSQAEATVAANKTDLGKAVIRSPINGIVITRSIEPGQTVAASLSAPTLFTLAEDLTRMELRVDVDEADVGKVRVGQQASFTVDAYPNRSFQATIRQIRYGSSTTDGVVTYKTILTVSNPDMQLRPGMTATADITVRQVANALLVPSAALRFVPSVKQQNKPSRGLVASLLPGPPRQPDKQVETVNAGKEKQQTLWVMNKGQLTPVSVAVGETDGKMTVVTSGDLKPGMQIVTDTAAGETK